ncbi:type IV pilus biogenesis/stability protein PilW [Alteromonas sp. ASW11-19]|uniref:Type IV pilus biogenesis/stability protein PilW n=1 Tax=Alteromonas salexigens TaxID=2982530 RepID=A0ABT2VQT8_9ALTE|nr:type IV pilus biogenesis/stability protein PilW [Alteromonas salexigens]MCU7555682.1 type IV pilus biogenesis/stability protein PilW [Alteromonas salexigens]
MRIALLALMLFMSGCVSQSQLGQQYGDDFDREEAAKTRISLGLTYLKNGDYQQAKANLDRALAFAPRLADAHYSLAYYYQLVEENQRAEEAYQAAMDLAPDNATIANSYGAFLCQTGQYDSAKRYFLKAVNSQQYANSAQTYENMAMCAQEQGEFADAIDYFSTALNYQPTRAKSLFLLTELYLKTEQWDKAAQTLTRFERVARVSPESLWLAVRVAQGQQNLEKAKGFGEMLLSMYPDSQQAAAYLRSREDEPAAVIMRKAKPSITNAEEVADNPAAESAVDESANSAKRKSAPTDTNKDAAMPRFHVVQAQENLYRISLRYNLKMATLQEWNNLESAGAIFAGMKLWLVPPQQQEE